MKNFISINIIYLMRKTPYTQNEFGALFYLKNGLIGNYVNEKALPKIETIQRICRYFEITIDDFVNRKLEEVEKENISMNYVSDVSSAYIVENEYVKNLKKQIEDKNKIIELLEEKIDTIKVG